MTTRAVSTYSGLCPNDKQCQLQLRSACVRWLWCAIALCTHTHMYMYIYILPKECLHIRVLLVFYLIKLCAGNFWVGTVDGHLNFKYWSSARIPPIFEITAQPQRNHSANTAQPAQPQCNHNATKTKNVFSGCLMVA